MSDLSLAQVCFRKETKIVYKSINEVEKYLKSVALKAEPYANTHFFLISN